MLTKNKKKASDSLVELKPKTGLIDLKDTNKVVLSLIGFSFVLVLMSFFSLTLTVTNNRLAAKKTIFVQTPEGEIVKASEQSADFRSDEVIKKFVVNWLQLTYKLDPVIPNSEKIDPGIQLKYSDGLKVKIPTKTYAGSYGIVDGFRQEFLKKFSEFVPEDFYRGNFSSALIVYDVSKPLRRKNGTIEVSFVATRIDKTYDVETNKIKLNKTIVLKPIEPYINLPTNNVSAFDKFLENELLKSGLLIVSIESHQ